MRIILAILFLSTYLPSSKAQVHTALLASKFENAINRSNIQLLDVRTSAEYKAGHLKNSFQADWYNQQQFKERVGNLDKSKPVYVYCLTGIRSAEAVKQLKQNGFSNVHDLKGGLTAWKLANMPVVGETQIKQISFQEYIERIKSSGSVLVDFSAEWCPPCKKMEPVITKLERDAFDKYIVVKVDAATQTEIMKLLKVEALPVFIVYKKGIAVWRKQGIVSLEELKSKLL